jgi:hypothetical protein
MHHSRDYRWADRLVLVLAFCFLLGVLLAVLAGLGLLPRSMVGVGLGVALPQLVPVCCFTEWRRERGLWMLAFVFLPLYLFCAACGLSDLFRRIRPSGLPFSLMCTAYCLLSAWVFAALARANWMIHRALPWANGPDLGGGNEPSPHPSPLKPSPHVLGAQAVRGLPGEHKERSEALR